MSRRRGRYPLLVSTLLAGAAAVASCRAQPDLTELLAQPVIVTKREPNTDFAAFRTFAITDSIPVESLFSLEAGASIAIANPAIANPTLDEISAQLTSRGYQQVTRTDGPDLGVAVTGVTKLNVAIGYGGWWGTAGTTPTFWGFSGAFVPSLTYTTIAWQSGTLVIELFDLRAARDEARRAGVPPGTVEPNRTAPIPVVWAAILHAVLGAAGATLDAPPIASIQQAFAQSPYLTRPPTPPEVQ